MSNTNSVSEKQRLTGTLLMLAASICFSTGGLLIKLVPWNPLAINGARNLIACTVIGLYILFTHHRIKFNFTVFVGAISMAGVTTLFAMANKLTTAGNTIILQYTAPIWIVILMFLFFRKKPDRTAMISILIVLAGILCFFFEALSTGKWLGDLLALLSGIFYAGVFMLNSFEKGDALSSVFFGQLACGLFLTPLVLRETAFSPQVLIPVILLGTVQVGIAYIFFTTGTKYTDPVTASIINALEPILNPVLVAIFYGEVLGKMSLIGAVIVLGGILFYNLKK
ncbi:MAG: DMT family transporter [Lachnospiraceae bacterium]|nr:DMT family transporter [Lachnospiraceae bacterium]